MNKYRPCNLCAGEEIKLLWIKDGYEIVQCQHCHLIFTQTILDDEGFYSEDFFVGKDQLIAGYTDYTQDREILGPELKRRLTRIKEFVKGGRLLDVGCALGFFLDETRDDFETFGVEISRFAAEYAREKLGLQVIQGRFLDTEFEPESFDCITFWDVIEHLPDPTLNLKKAFNLLKPDGLLVLSTGDIGSFGARLMGRHWHLLLPPQHIYYFSQETIKKLLEKTGFEVIEIKYWGKVMTLTHFVRRLRFLFKNKLLYHLFNPFGTSSLGRMSIELNLFDIMTVFARKGK
ncbi:MAG: class I SAM-dependent methyltransferase [bacterium]|nr:class I SAM-dependent methyltransferase [bacterium]